MIYDESFDRLTKLQSFDSFLQELRHKEEKAASNLQYALIIISIHDLKEINLSLGVEIGNQLIRGVLSRLRTIFSNDKYLSRYSGDSFAIIAKVQPKIVSYQALVEKIINTISKPFHIDSHEISIDSNIGACIFPKKRQDQRSLKESAEIALLHSKRAGKNTYQFYSQELNMEYSKKMTLANDLKYAIQNDQLDIYYQPIINLRDNQIVAAEALVRWDHPEWGVISPDMLLTLAEETKFILKIRKWMLQTILSDHKKWVDRGLPAIEMGMNFSATELSEKGFVEKTQNIMDEFHFNPELLIMGITEKSFMHHQEKVKKDLKELKAAGVKIAIDHFGTAYSDLAHFNSVMIDILKLDQGFAGSIPSTPTGRAITKSIVELAKELRIEIVAEGIKNSKQLNYLRRINCTYGQGAVYSKPLDSDDFEEFLRYGIAKPNISTIYKNDPDKNRRKFFRIDFTNPLEAEMTILKVDDQKVRIGYNKILIENIGPGGLSFISNVKLPAEKDLLLKFVTKLIGEKIVALGSPVWTGKIKTFNEDNLYKYRIEFKIDEADRADLVKILNKVQIKMRNNVFFTDGRFISTSYKKYFN